MFLVFILQGMCFLKISLRFKYNFICVIHLADAFEEKYVGYDSIVKPVLT